jgi:hypothetical protein
MNQQHYLAASMPQPMPHAFEFDGREWNLFPLETVGIAQQLERWVVQFVRANVEKLRPDDGNDDPLAWRIYQEDRQAAQAAIQRGLYGALTPGWESILEGTEAGFAEALYQCVRFKEPDWTRELTRRFLADSKRKEEFYASWREFNHPKAPAPAKTTTPGSRQPNADSAGTSSSGG